MANTIQPKFTPSQINYLKGIKILLELRASRTPEPPRKKADWREVQAAQQLRALAERRQHAQSIAAKARRLEAFKKREAEKQAEKALRALATRLLTPQHEVEAFLRAKEEAYARPQSKAKPSPPSHSTL